MGLITNRKITAFTAALIMFLFVPLSHVAADESIPVFNVGEEIIVSIDGIYGTYVNSRTEGYQDTYSGSGSIETGGTSVQESVGQADIQYPDISSSGYSSDWYPGTEYT